MLPDTQVMDGVADEDLSVPPATGSVKVLVVAWMLTFKLAESSFLEQEEVATEKAAIVASKKKVINSSHND